MTSPPDPARTVDPTSLVKKLCRKKSTAVVLLRGTRLRGEIYLWRGRVVRAVCDALEGEEAVLEMLAWQDAKIQIAPLLEVPELNVLSDLKFLSSPDEAAPRPRPSASLPSTRSHDRAAPR